MKNKLDKINRKKYTATEKDFDPENTAIENIQNDVHKQRLRK